MGSAFTTYVYPTYKDPSSMPDISKPSKFDPLLGFPNGRKVRPLPQVTMEEMIAANLTPREMDYCADKLIAVKKCMSEINVIFFNYYCDALKHDYFDCELQDYNLRIKEYERERRLLARERRLNGA